MAEGSSRQWLWWTAGGVVVLFAMMAKDFWSTLGILGGAEIIAYALIKMSRVNEASARPQSSQHGHEPTLAELTGSTPRGRATASAVLLQQTQNFSGSRGPQQPSASQEELGARKSAVVADAAVPRLNQTEKFYSTQKPPSAVHPSYALPEAPAAVGNKSWVPPGESVQIAGLNLPGGMIYVGTRLVSPNGCTDPCLINGLLAVASAGDYRVRQMGYWPSYTEASPVERRAYLNWLAEGRSNADCDLGYVFLFFYGLERRILLDSRDEQAAKGDWPAIIDELRRLLAIYGEKPGSFRHYASNLLSWIELDGLSGRLYEKSVPTFPKTYELPPYLRLALGQAAAHRAPIPASLALAWVRLSPDTYLRTAAKRCPDEFGRLFDQHYQEIFGTGLVLCENRTKLKFTYRAASAGLLGTTITMDFGGIPDVTAVTEPIKRLRDIANQCTDEMEPYSRLLGRDPSLAGSLESILFLPPAIWPEGTKAGLHALVGRVPKGGITLTLQELFDALGRTKRPPNRDHIRNLARVLEDMQVGMEPHVLGGAKVPCEADKVVLFPLPTSDPSASLGPEYQTIALTLKIGSALAQADGDFSAREIEHLRAKIDDWAQLTPAERCRLHAHLQWLIANPPTLTVLRRKLEPLDAAARETIAAFMVTLAQSDGYVSPEEVKFLEKLYKALEIEPKRVFSDIQAAGTDRSTLIATTHPATRGFHLDADRIVALQKDTARVSTFLSGIFAEEAPVPETSPPPEPESSDVPTSPLGLDEAHSALVHLLLSRPQWTRAELEDAAADLGLMTDGALEQINEAAFEAFDTPLCEGDDPIDVNTELLRKLAA